MFDAAASTGQPDLAVAIDGQLDSSPRLDLLRGELVALAAELDAVRVAAASVAVEHRAELELLQAEVLEARRALVTVQDSLSWRLTQPVRALGRVLRSGESE